MRVRQLVLLGAVGFATACVLESSSDFGPCNNNSDCPDLFVCNKSATDLGSTCQPIGIVLGSPDSGNPGGGGPLPNGGNPGGGNAVYYCGAVKQALDVLCGGCHGAPPNTSGIPTFRLDVYDNVGGVSGAKTIAARVDARLNTPASPMPPANYIFQPTAAQKDLLLAWVRGGALNCADAGSP